jgi:hypothetical protein
MRMSIFEWRDCGKGWWAWVWHARPNRVWLADQPRLSLHWRSLVLRPAAAAAGVSSQTGKRERKMTAQG